MDNSLAILALKALDGLSARATATAENIANANTPGYRPLRVSFEQALQQAALSGDDAVRDVQPSVARAPSNTPDGELRLDLETGTAAGTALRYSALIEVLDRQTQMQSLAITGNS
jgi:flagellar basal-body rod protein FlgB